MKLALSDVAASAMTQGLRAVAWCSVDEAARAVVINVGPMLMQPKLQGTMPLREARELMLELQAAVAGLEMLERNV